jgi:hypothetical protein
MGQFSILVMPSLAQGDCVYPFDTCVQRVGEVVCLSDATAAPALSWLLLFTVVAFLVSAGFVRVRLSESRRAG